MTSNELSRCCTIGSLHEGEAKGEIKDIGDFSTYFAYPTNRSNEKAILILTDVIGHRLINAQLIADQFTSKGYLVVMPDLFNGDTVGINRPEGFQIMEWVKNHLPPQTQPIIDAVLKEMRENMGRKRIGGVGYCFGGKYVCRYLKGRQLDAGFIAHPTMVEADELKVRDFVFTTEKRRESEDILDQMDVPYRTNLLSDVGHIFSVFNQAAAWFDEYLKE
ncbi:hypothetical protein N7532_008758 [Penicillium argentinense]|uniref:Dienelactone hydrolase domain-containing protein n=1 Tax=Penicillium argentinense TaxID=1131581 RepID=A0A9W9K1W5_9EURO|nr:uncharacterized protein N7532_008758 [Penicillium argentinense]KAJ5090074.1 hypothetical protein N7532_008758 [Penicillium argentinense]